jgi:hypothetical protein
MMKLDSKVYVSVPGLDTIDSRKNTNSVNCISTEYSEANMDRKSDRKLVSFRLPEDLMQDLRERAESDNISVTELVYRLLKQGLHANVDDRISVLEAEIQELRRLRQMNFSSISPAPVYTMLPHSGYAPENDIETRQRVAKLEARLEEVMTNVKHIGALPAYLAKLETLIEEVQTNRAASQDPLTNAPANTWREEAEPKNVDREVVQSAYPTKKNSSETGRSSEEVV